MISFYLNDQPIQTSEPAPSALLDFVRYHEHLTGTKIGCREGDCGACTVLVGELAPDGQRIQYQSQTSCLTPLGNCHGKHVVTVEGINRAGGQLTPVQQAIVDSHGAQCGFCTVGFVMSLTGHSLAAGQPATEASARAAIDGNICRCTGYKSLERAAARLTAQLAARPAPPEALGWLAGQHYVPAYFRAMPARLAALRAAAEEEAAASGSPGRVPPQHGTGVNGYAASVATSPGGHAHAQNGQHPAPAPFTHALVSGGTDLLVQQLDTLREQPVRLLLGEPARRGLRQQGGRVVLGAATTATQLLESNLLRQLLPSLPQYLKLVSSTPIRNMGTVAGNFINASPIGDLTILFLALGADVTLRHPAGATRTLPLAELYLGYKKLAKEPAEQLTEISFAAPQPGDLFHFEKVSKRTHLDIASVNTACWLRLENNVVSAARLSAGGVGPVPLLLRGTGEFLLGRALDADTLAGANEVMQEEISPISDVRGTAAYKRRLLRQLLMAHFTQFGVAVEELL